MADPVVDGHESSLRPKSFLNRQSQQTRIREELSQKWRFDINQRIKMLFRNQKAVAGEDRTMIQKGKAVGIFEDNGCRNGTADDLAKDAGVHEVVGLLPAVCSYAVAFRAADSMDEHIIFRAGGCSGSRTGCDS